MNKQLIDITKLNDKVELSRRDLYCIAKNLKSLGDTGFVMSACLTCKIPCWEEKGRTDFRINEILIDFESLTGVKPPKFMAEDSGYTYMVSGELSEDIMPPNEATYFSSEKCGRCRFRRSIKTVSAKEIFPN